MALIPVIGRMLKLKWALAGLLAIGAWEAYTILRPEPIELDEPRRKVADEACWQAVERLPSLDIDGQVAVLRLDGDKTGYVTKRLRQLIERTGKYRQPAESLVTRVMQDLQIEETPVADPQQAASAGRRMKVPYVLLGRVHRFASDRRQGVIEMELTVLDVEKRSAVAEPLLVAVPSPGARPGAPGHASSRWSAPATRALIWLAAVVLLPLATMPLIRRVLARESNTATGVALGAYAVVGWLVALALVGFNIAGWLPGLLMLAAFVIALAYDYYAFNRIEQNR